MEWWVVGEVWWSLGFVRLVMFLAKESFEAWGETTTSNFIWQRNNLLFIVV